MTSMKPSDEVLKHTKAKQQKALQVLQLMRHSLTVPETLPKNFYHWADNTVFPTVSETNAPTFLRFGRPGFGVAYAWIAPVITANGERLYASIMQERGSAIQEIARVMDLELEGSKKKWKDINDKFLAQVGFFHNKKASFIQALSGAWSSPTLSEEDSAEGLAHLHATAGAAAVLLRMKYEKPAGPGV
ncbi:hypothetical protein BDP27DRAFT_1321258 [Rhodocollybia butyracea]|uniref:Uncharacterized protein n=1 Tax=Rhodocollybia butyracea TaxID=206335 RepID=A0A9P5UAG2_9AGAR|nr:hypothetical protein BDP27DRAFT_1321258 [Rhodocollybia butyracea]